MKVNKYVYNCDRCGKDAGYPPLYTVDVYSKYDKSLLGNEYHFCKDCYEKIYDVIKGKENKKNVEEKIVYYPVYPVYVYPPKKDLWTPAYPKVTYTDVSM